MIRFIKGVMTTIWFCIKSFITIDLYLVLMSFKHPNYSEEIIKGNMPLYETYKDKDGKVNTVVSSEPWSDYCFDRSIVEIALIYFDFYKNIKFIRLNNV